MALPQDRIGVAVTIGTQTIAMTGSLVFSNSNGVSFGLQESASSYVMTMSASNVGAGGLGSISAGTQQATSSQVVFANSNGVSFGVNGSTITAQSKQISLWSNNRAGGNKDAQNGVLSLQRVAFGARLDATRADLIGSIATTIATDGTYGISLGMYTLSGSTASLVSSATVSVTWNSNSLSTAASLFGGQTGQRWRSVPLGTWSITAGDYLLGILFTQSGGGGFSVPMGFVGSESNQVLYEPSETNLPYFGAGKYSTTTAALPASVQLSQVVQTISYGFGFPDTGMPALFLVGTF